MMTAAQRAKAEGVFAPISNDHRDIVRRRYRSLKKDCPFSALKEVAEERGYSILKIGDHVVFFQKAKIVWLSRPLPVEVYSGASTDNGGPSISFVE